MCHGRKTLIEERTYPQGCVNSQQILRLIKGEEARFPSFVFIEGLSIRSRLYSGIHVTQAVKENFDLSLRIRIDEAQENSTAFEEVRVSEKGKVRSDLDRLNWSRTLRRSPRGREKIEKVAR